MFAFHLCLRLAHKSPDIEWGVADQQDIEKRADTVNLATLPSMGFQLAMITGKGCTCLLHDDCYFSQGHAQYVTRHPWLCETETAAIIYVGLHSLYTMQKCSTLQCSELFKYCARHNAYWWLYNKNVLNTTVLQRKQVSLSARFWISWNCLSNRKWHNQFAFQTGKWKFQSKISLRGTSI